MKHLVALLLTVVTVGLGPSLAAQRGAAPPKNAPQPKPTATTGAPVVSEVLAMQVMLDRAGFSPGEIDGRTGPNVRRALSAFQKAHGLMETGTLDDATWQQLGERSAQQAPLTTYEITQADVQGPFTPEIPADLVEQGKLEALSYTNPLEKIAERFHASPRVLQELNKGAMFSSAGERIVVPNVEPFELPARENLTEQTGRGRRGARGRGAQDQGAQGRGNAAGPTGEQAVTIAVTKSTSALTVEDASGRVLFHAPVTSGSERDPLPIGNWKVTGVHTMPVFNYNPDLFWDADPAHTKAKIPAGPNNPVGIAWIDLSKEHYGIHGTPEPSRIGHTQSHGCVRLTNWDVQRVLQWARPGTAVVFRE